MVGAVSILDKLGYSNLISIILDRIGWPFVGFSLGKVFNKCFMELLIRFSVNKSVCIEYFTVKSRKTLIG